MLRVGIALVLALAVGAGALAGEPNDATALGQLAWLEGAWSLDYEALPPMAPRNREERLKPRRVDPTQVQEEEHWLPQRGNAMCAVRRTTFRGKVTRYELLSIEERDGVVRLATRTFASDLRMKESALSKKVAGWPATQIDARSVTFREPEAPHRAIRYVRLANDRVRVERRGMVANAAAGALVRAGALVNSSTQFKRAK